MMGQYGPGVRKNALWMLRKNLIHLTGTDTHHQGHIEQFKKALGKNMFESLHNYPFIDLKQWDHV